ncbi:MAG TPA: YceI family protein [Trebonia sp.]|jgi:polyisoprenoid-binding protein YceI|nr:YceI family protein [Trebonia sp.]
MSGGLSARLRTKDGWAVKNAILTVTDLTGQQAGRADGGDDGVAATGPLPPGTYTAIVIAPGYEPAARTVVVPVGGTATLGTITLVRAAGGVELPPPGKWTIDPAHSAVTITARHLGMASVTGSIGDFSGTIEIAEPLESSAVRAVMRADSIDTGNKVRDDHLRSQDFLDVVSYPQIEYVGTSVVPDGGDRWTVEGSLTLRGTTKPVPLDLTYLGTSPDPWGAQRAAFRATAELRRKDFAMDWNQVLPTGSVLVGWVMRVTLDIEAVEGDLPDA